MSNCGAIIVTGGARGIGKACAIAMAEVGHPIALWDWNEEQAVETASSISNAYNVPTHVEKIDIASTKDFNRAVLRTRSEVGAINGLVHAAGISHEATIDQLDESDWDRVQSINLRSYPFLVKAILTDLKEFQNSSIVGIASINALLGNGLIPAYTVSKAGIIALTQSLADTLGNDQIRINAVCPGYIRSEMSQDAFDRTPGLEDMLRNQTFLNRIGTPEEVAYTVRFLMSKEASYITGQSIIVDAGACLSQL